jgi:hypothetical protein
MSVQFHLDLEDEATASAVAHALDAYVKQVRSSIERTRRRLRTFEERHGVSTDVLLNGLTAEDVPGGDMEYVGWTGEARLLDGLLSELHSLERARNKLP